jgi:O-acetyl-ADP-ribose deacetylase (regulator of RNase III)
MRLYRFGSVAVELTVGDIAAQHGFDAVINAAHAQLRTGGGVAGALHSAAGPGLEEETRPLAPIRPGEAVLTSGHMLPNRHLIHCLGPIYGRDEPSDALLSSCYREALRIAEREGLRSVAFPAISTGAFASHCGLPPTSRLEQSSGLPPHRPVGVKRLALPVRLSSEDNRSLRSSVQQQLIPVEA